MIALAHKQQADISQARTKLIGRIPLEFILDKEDEGIKKTFYYTTDLDIEDHEPISENGKLREGLKVWQTVDIPIKAKLMQQYVKIPPVGPRRKGNITRYVVWAWLKLERTGPGDQDIQLSWELAPPGWRPNSDGNIRKHDVGVKELQADILHSSQHSPFLQRNNAQSPGLTRLPLRSQSTNDTPTGSSRKKGPQYDESFDTDDETLVEEKDSDYLEGSQMGRKRGRGRGTPAGGKRR